MQRAPLLAFASLKPNLREAIKAPARHSSEQMGMISALQLGLGGHLRHGHREIQTRDDDQSEHSDRHDCGIHTGLRFAGG